MSKQIDALKLALEALKLIAAQDQGCGGTYTEAEAWRSAKSIALANITAIKEALAQPEQEPVAWMQDTTCGLYVIDHPDEWHCIPLYTTPPQRKPLPPQSPCEMTQAESKMFKLGWLECEAAHDIKG